MERLHYPTPRCPDIFDPVISSENLVPHARRVVGKPPFEFADDVRKVLLVVPPDQDPMVLAAVRQALKEKQIDTDVVYEHECGFLPPLEQLKKVSAADGWNELFWRSEVSALLPSRLQELRPPAFHQLSDSAFESFKVFMAAHDQYDSVFCGSLLAGHADRKYRNALGNQGDKFRGFWNLRTGEDLLSQAKVFPDDLWQMIESKTLRVIPHVAQVRVTDPQGTELWFSVTKEEADLWAEAAAHRGHLMMYPNFADSGAAQTQTTPERTRLVHPKAHGVIAGTGNHFGYYPHMRAFVEDGVVRRLEGGGLFGQALREIMFQTGEFQYPTYPWPGYYYLSEGALGSQPEGFRDTVTLFGNYRAFVNAAETRRAGVIHWGIGVDSSQPEVLRFAKEKHLPHRHSWHIHNYMSTYEVELRDSGKWTKLVDRGHLTALDDPEVQALAARLGVPLERLKEAWVPALPGINYPGDYMRDYGTDPACWIRKEQEGRLPTTIGVP